MTAWAGILPLFFSNLSLHLFIAVPKDLLCNAFLKMGVISPPRLIRDVQIQRATRRGDLPSASIKQFHSPFIYTRLGRTNLLLQNVERSFLHFFLMPCQCFFPSVHTTCRMQIGGHPYYRHCRSVIDTDSPFLRKRLPRRLSTPAFRRNAIPTMTTCLRSVRCPFVAIIR